MQLKFEDVKRKLKQLDSKSTSDTHTQPSKKSRPLVLPTSQSSATSVCKKSPAMSLPVRKELHKGKPSSRSKNPKSQPGSPRVTEERRSHAKTPASKPGAPAISSGAGSPLSLDDTAEDGYGISYAEQVLSHSKQALGDRDVVCCIEHVAQKPRSLVFGSVL